MRSRSWVLRVWLLPAGGLAQPGTSSSSSKEDPDKIASAARKFVLPASGYIRLQLSNAILRRPELVLSGSDAFLIPLLEGRDVVVRSIFSSRLAPKGERFFVFVDP